MRKPFIEKDYTYDATRRRYNPFLEVQVGTKASKKPVTALVDTGCTPCMSLLKSYVDQQGLSFIQKMNNEPVPVGVADGHTINADYYKAICEIDGKEMEIAICVIDPVRFFEEASSQIGAVEPLLGRGILDEYDVFFEGKNKKFTLFHSVSEK